MFAARTYIREVQFIKYNEFFIEQYIVQTGLLQTSTAAFNSNNNQTDRGQSAAWLFLWLFI